MVNYFSSNFCFVFFFFFFFKQKTAYEILTCDWSSDVCSSDLLFQVLVIHALKERDGDGLQALRREIHSLRLWTGQAVSASSTGPSKP